MSQATRRWQIAGAVVLVLAVLAVFGRVAGFKFLLYDDDLYLIKNPAVQGGLSLQSVRWALGSFHEGTWQPLTWLSYLAEIRVFGLRPGPMHIDNLLLHLFTSLLLWRFLARVTKRHAAAFVVALVFALHPLQVQSVAWIAERKGLLAAFFGMLTLDQWVGHARGGSRRAFVLSHLAFVASLASKPVLIPLPLLLILLDRWPLGRASWRHPLLSEKMPMFGIAAAGIVVAAFAQASASALSTLSEVGLLPRLFNAVLAWAATLRRFVAPFDLAAFYPFRFDHSPATVGAWAVVLLLGSVMAWRLRERRPAWTVGWMWWFVLQAPTVGLLQFGAQGTADRFSYLPLIGLAVMLVYGLADRFPSGRGGWALVAAMVLGLGALSSIAVRPWHDTIPLFEQSIARGGGSSLEHQNLSQAYLQKGDLQAAMRHSSRAKYFAPYSPVVLFQYADLLLAQRNFEAAEEQYREGLRLDPGHSAAWAQIGRLYAMRQEWEMSGRAWYRALLLEPDNPVYLLGLAKAMHGEGNFAEEFALYARALEADPGLPGIRSEMGWIQATSEDPALRDPATALRLAEIDFRLSGEESARALEVQAAAKAALGDMESAHELSARAEAKAVEIGADELVEDIRERRSAYLQ